MKSCFGPLKALEGQPTWPSKGPLDATRVHLRSYPEDNRWPTLEVLNPRIPNLQLPKPADSEGRLYFACKRSRFKLIKTILGNRMGKKLGKLWLIGIVNWSGHTVLHGSIF